LFLGVLNRWSSLRATSSVNRRTGSFKRRTHHSPWKARTPAPRCPTASLPLWLAEAKQEEQARTPEPSRGALLSAIQGIAKKPSAEEDVSAAPPPAARAGLLDAIRAKQAKSSSASPSEDSAPPPPRPGGLNFLAELQSRGQKKEAAPSPAPSAGGAGGDRGGLLAAIQARKQQQTEQPAGESQEQQTEGDDSTLTRTAEGSRLGRRKLPNTAGWKQKSQT
jgi:hypothetical protein